VNGNNSLRVGTRASLLARIQTDWVLRELRNRHRNLNIEVITIRTTGDAVTDRALSRIGGKGLFTKELEDALLKGQIDFAVHSLKDLPTDLPEGLALGAVPKREDARDALVGMTIEELKHSRHRAKIGTSSLRRMAQLRRMFPNAEVLNLRGNLDTRLRKVKDGVVDCAVLALAGLCRLAREDQVSAVFDPDQMLPAPGQGALGIEIRNNDRPMRELLETIRCETSERCVLAERAFLTRLGGGCQVPVGAFARLEGDTLRLKGRVISPEGRRLVEGSRCGSAATADEIGRQLADDLLEKGAGEIIAEVRPENTEEKEHA